MSTDAVNYVRHGWALVRIARGTKGPTEKDWNSRARCISDENEAARLTDCNVGLAHAYSGTCAIDFDNLAEATKWLGGEGIDATALLTHPDAVRISSGRPNRAKLLYRLAEPLTSIKVADYVDPEGKKGKALEFRCATGSGLSVQDVLPPSIHPVTKEPYRWEYNDALSVSWQFAPEIPESLLALWKRLTARPDRPAVERDNEPVSLDDVRVELFKHDPSAPEEEWHRCLMAVHHATQGSREGLDLADEWSRGGKNYGGRGVIESRWRSWKLDHPKPITFASLRKHAEPATADEFDNRTGEPITNDLSLKGLSPALPSDVDRGRKRIANTLNLALALRRPDWTRVRVAFDTFKDETLIAPWDREEWRPLRDEDLTIIQEGLERNGFRQVTREVLRHVIAMVAKENEFDSAIRWLDGLTWDGVERVERFLTDYCAAEDSAYTRAVSRYLWTALAGRVRQPGCKADMVPIFVGEQGIKKTSGIQALVVSPDHFVEISLTERDDNLSRKMRGRLVGEIGELRGLATRDLEAIKSFITRTHETWTPKYRELAHTFARRLVLIGTTNDDEFLSDRTGNRRWLPVEVNDVDVARIEADRLQLWAEGDVLWLCDGVAWQAAQGLAPEYHGQHIVSDSWEDAIREWLDKPYIVCDREDFRGPHPDGLKNGERPFTTQEVLVDAIDLLVANTNRAHEMRAARVLTALGYRKERKMLGGSRAHYWLPAAG